MQYEMIRERLDSGNIDNAGLIGQPGYTLPGPDGMQAHTLVDLAKGAVANITVQGEVTEETGTLFLHRAAALAKPLRLHVNCHVRRAIIVIGAECQLWGDLNLWGDDQLVVLAGGAATVGHAGYFTLQTWSSFNTLFVGHGATTNGNAYLLAGPGKSVIVGDDCMFANNISLRTDDQHAVVEMETGTWRNPQASIVIEPHVWLSEGVSVGKGVVVGLGSVVGARSLALRSCPRFSLLVGVPAGVLRAGISWDRKNTPSPGLVEGLRQLATKVPAAPAMVSRDTINPCMSKPV